MTKLILTIVRDQDAGKLIEALIAREYRATRINTAGGFLKRGNATLLVGVQDDQVDDVIGLVQDICRSSASPTNGDGAGVLFVLPVAASFRA